MTLKELQDKIGEWQCSDSKLPLYSYLGWTESEYVHWLKTGEIPHQNKKVEQ